MKTNYIYDKGKVSLNLIAENSFDNNFLQHIINNTEKIKIERWHNICEKSGYDIHYEVQIIVDEAASKIYDEQMEFLEKIESLNNLENKQQEIRDVIAEFLKKIKV